jgi:hypothetical protein
MSFVSKLRCTVWPLDAYLALGQAGTGLRINQGDVNANALKSDLESPLLSCKASSLLSRAIQLAIHNINTLSYIFITDKQQVTLPSFTDFKTTTNTKTTYTNEEAKKKIKKNKNPKNSKNKNTRLKKIEKK